MYFREFIASDPEIYSNFSVIKNAPRQMFKAHVIEYAGYLKKCGLKHSSIYQYINALKSLFNVYRQQKVN